MSELQTAEAAEVVEEVATEVEAESPTQDSESAPDTGENQEEKITFSDDQQKILNKMKAEDAFKLREKDREAEKLRKELEETRSKLPQETRPDVPAAPDPYDDDFEVKLQERDELIRKAAEFDASQAVLQQQKEARAQEELQKQQEAFDQKLASYSDRAVKLGLDDQRLKAAAQKIEGFGIDPLLVDYLLDDDHGPIITTYLGENLIELDELNRIGRAKSIEKIAVEIKEKAKGAFNVKKPTAPDPVETLSGTGAAPKRAGPPGTIYE